MSNVNPADWDPPLRAVHDAYAVAREQPDDRSALRRALEELSRAADAAPHELQPAMSYHRARFSAMSGDKPAALRMLDELLATEHPLPEAIVLYNQVAYVEDDDAVAKRRWELEARLGELLPISTWGHLRDGNLEVAECNKRGAAMSDNPDRPIIPLIKPRPLRRVAECYEDMRLFDLAVSAYAEAIYGGLGAPDAARAAADTWLGEEAADAWMSRARCAMYANKPGACGHSLLMAVAAPGGRLGRASDLARQLAARPKPPEPLPTRGGYREIAECCRDCNLHPRAIEALDAAAKLPGADLAPLRRDTEHAWRELLREYSERREQTCFLFGVRYADAADPVALAPRHFGM